MIFALLLQAATAPPAPDDIRCIGLLSVVAEQQRRGVTAALAYPPLERDGERYAEAIGQRLQTEGVGRQTAGRRMLAAAKAVRADYPDIDRALPGAEMVICLDKLRTVIPAAPTLTLPQCAALMARAEAESRVREGEGENTRYAAELAAALNVRARAALAGVGNDGAAVDRIMAEERARVAGQAPDLTPCVAMATQ